MKSNMGQYRVDLSAWVHVWKKKCNQSVTELNPFEYSDFLEGWNNRTTENVIQDEKVINNTNFLKM